MSSEAAAASKRLKDLELLLACAKSNTNTSLQTVSAASAPAASGAVNTLVMMVNFQDNPGAQPWTVSLLLERWLMTAFGKESAKLWNDIAKKSPEFKRAAEAWLRSEVPKMFDRKRTKRR